MESCLLDIDVSGVILEKQNTAKEEIYNHFIVFAEKFGVKIKILVATEFDSMINELLDKKSGLNHHYNSKREQGIVATAKTFSCPQRR
jgi:hypothetical protein